MWRLSCGWLLVGGLWMMTGACSEKASQTGTGGDGVREYSLRGRVETIDPGRKRAVIAHEEIPGYMKPMTMGFSIPDEKVLQSLHSGDRIEARLVFDPKTNLSWLEGVQVIPPPASDAPAPSP
ncbi:MAG: copper-binding protein [Blastocatellia bacterium]